ENSFLYKLQSELRNKGFMLPRKDLFTLIKPSSDKAVADDASPVLRLIVRASGINNPKGQYLLDSSAQSQAVPKTVIEQDNYNPDIKKHGLSVLLHLAPGYKQKDSTPFYEDRINLYWNRLKKNNSSRPSVYQAVIAQGFFSLYCQTGFASCNG